MKVIYKYPLGVEGEVTKIEDWLVQIFDIQSQDGQPVMWALVDTDRKEEIPVEIYCAGTGWSIPDGVHYLGTAIAGDGYVWHYFANEQLFTGTEES